ncbi:MAG: hypothetical protein J6T15_05325 [Bacilli bacterium]|nr:hypothetical protein [Bacilli bacterium]
MGKLKTGISTDMDFIKLMKEKGQDVNAEFPAETLRTQLDLVSETVKVTFNSTNETILEAVNEEEPPIVTCTVTFNVAGLETGDVPTVTVGEEVITTLPATLVEDIGTELPFSVSCEGYVSQEGTITFDEDKEVTVTLEKVPVIYTLTLNFNGAEDTEGHTSKSIDFEEGVTAVLSSVFDASTLVTPYWATSLTGWSEEATYYDEITEVVMNSDVTVYANWTMKSVNAWQEETKQDNMVFKDNQSISDIEYLSDTLHFILEADDSASGRGKFTYHTAGDGHFARFILEVGDSDLTQIGLHVEWEEEDDSGSSGIFQLSHEASYYNGVYFSQMPYDSMSSYRFPVELNDEYFIDGASTTELVDIFSYLVGYINKS